MERMEEGEDAVILEDPVLKKPNEEDSLAAGGGKMTYAVNDVPPFHLTILLAIQQVMMIIPGSLSVPLLLSELLCAKDPAPVRAKLFGISLFLCGLATILQSTLGIRLPIIQGGSHAFLPPITGMLALDRWRCPEEPRDDPDEAWMIRMRELQGNLILASLIQVLLGCTGILGFLMRFIGPLTVAPTIALIGLSLTSVVTKYSEVHWGIAFMTVVLVVVFSLILGRYQQPVPSCSRDKGCHIQGFPFFQLFAVILAISLSWLFCFTLTVTDGFPGNASSPGYYARTDTRSYVLREVPWFSVPYPFQFGMVTFSAAGFVGMLTATLSSIIESVGDYFAMARACQAPPPPSSAINRGVAMEGVASIFSGMLGAGHATTSYSGNAGAVALTKVGSRRVFLVAGLILLVSGMLGKLGGALSLIPEPVMGGALGVILSMVSSIGLTTVLHANMNVLRNLAIFGMAITLGLAVPQWVSGHPGAIATDNVELDQMILVLLSTPMCVGGLIGFLLDNIVPGTLEERGILRWRRKVQDNVLSDDNDLRKVYDIPYVSRFIRKMPFCSYVPISPSFQYLPLACCFAKKAPYPDGKKIGNAQVNNVHELERHSLDTKL